MQVQRAVQARSNLSGGLLFGRSLQTERGTTGVREAVVTSGLMNVGMLDDYRREWALG
jgi:hypothetical protein